MLGKIILVSEHLLPSFFINGLLKCNQKILLLCNKSFYTLLTFSLSLKVQRAKIMHVTLSQKCHQNETLERNFVLHASRDRKLINLETLKN